MKDPLLNNQKDALKTLQSLNEKIVAARRRGDLNEAAKLKKKVQTLLAWHTQNSQTASPATAKEEIAEERIAPNQSEQEQVQEEEQIKLVEEAPKPFDRMKLMAELQEVNREIVQARRSGNDSLVQKLTARAKNLMDLATSKP